MPENYTKTKHPRKISDKTKAHYDATMHTLFSKTTRDLGIVNRDPTPLELAQNLARNYYQYRPNTFSMYRSALIWWLNHQQPTDNVMRARLELDNLPRDGFKGTKPGQTSSLYSNKSIRKRTFARKDFEKLLTELAARASLSQRDGRRKTRAASKLSAWLLSGLASGLRPIEWKDAKWDDSGEYLIVNTAKFKEDISALGVETKKARVRKVYIEPEDRLIVSAHLKYVASHLAQGKSFASYYQSNRQMLHNVCSLIFKKDPQNNKGYGKAKFTLYMMRGQFAANRKWAKGSVNTSEEMGCSVTMVHGCYGQRIHAHRGAGGQMPPKHTENKKELLNPQVSDSAKHNERE